MLLHFMSGFVCWLDSGASMHWSSDYFSAENACARLCFPFCCRLALLCTIVVGTQGDGLCALEDLAVVLCNSVGSSEVVECLFCRCLLRCMSPMCRCLWCVSG